MPYPPSKGIFRENVAAIIRSDDGRILLGEIAKNPGLWSFPQGGVETGESRRKALTREILEEAGIRSKAYKILISRSGYRYLYPEKKRKKGIYRGQIQTYFLCQLKDSPEKLIPTKRNLEFLRIAWLQPSSLTLQLFPPHKHQVLHSVFHDFFGIHLNPNENQQATP